MDGACCMVMALFWIGFWEGGRRENRSVDTTRSILLLDLSKLLDPSRSFATRDGQLSPSPSPSPSPWFLLVSGKLSVPA